ncbi:MAG: AraC family transcriptional regulator [Methylobacteriaceae bacterium]|nr:AraC family transcriptional regulator [Methylobacteriaceae bacterium]
MLTNSLANRPTATGLFDGSPVRLPTYPVSVSRPRPARMDDVRRFGLSNHEHSIGRSSPTVDVSPRRLVARRGRKWQGMEAEFVQATSHDRIEYSFRSPVHLLAVYQHGSRRDGESYVEGLPRSTLRDVTKKLIFVPAGHQYREWHDPRTLPSVMYFYFDPAELQGLFEATDTDMVFAPRLFFEDATIWSTAVKLKQAIDARDAENQRYLEALGIVLVHELIRLNRGTPRIEAPVRGGLAAWQQRIVTAYIDEHLPEQISLATLAGLARLSTYYFCRAFKQSFGIPPHRYHTSRRIEQAKVMLAARKYSVTEVGLTLGFSDTSSFTAAFRKIAGQTPSTYHRSLG